MRVAGGRRAVSRPAGMRDADVARRRVARQLALEIAELALGTPADELPFMQRADAGAVVAPVLHAAQAIDEPLRDRFLADDTDDAAHDSMGP